MGRQDSSRHQDSPGAAPGRTHSGVIPSNTQVPPDAAACLQREARGCRAALRGRRTRVASACSDPLPFSVGARVSVPSGGEALQNKRCVPLGMATFAKESGTTGGLQGGGHGQDSRLSGLWTRVGLGGPSLSLTWLGVWSSWAGGGAGRALSRPVPLLPAPVSPMGPSIFFLSHSQRQE